MLEVFATPKNAISLPDDFSWVGADMEPDDFSFIMGFLRASRENACILSGNEPLLHRRISDLLAVSAEREVYLIIETTGLAQDALKTLPEKNKYILRWKIYHRDIYPAGAWDKVMDNLAQASKSGSPVEVSLVMHDMVSDYGFLPKRIAENKIAMMNINVMPQALKRAAAGGPEGIRGFGERLASLVKGLLSEGIRVSLGCIFTACFFSDSEYGFLSRAGITAGRCRPNPGILPDLRLYHCRQLITDASMSLRDFRDFPELMSCLFDKYGQVQRKHYLFKECRGCISHKGEACLGGCLALKI